MTTPTSIGMDPSALFRHLDKDQNGTLSLEELQCGLSDFGMDEATIQQMFINIDSNNDEQISAAEWSIHHMQQSGIELDSARLPAPGPDQMSLKPPQWALTLGQFYAFAEGCRRHPSYEQLPKPVNMYTINSKFVQPWTANAGASVSLVFNPRGRPAMAMASHAWKEDYDELEDAIKKYQEQHHLEDNFAIWLCTFSQYQAHSVLGKGPTISAQLALDPFSQVIAFLGPQGKSSKWGLIAIHTTQEDLYCRLWCPFEMHESIVAKLRIDVACSSKYVQKQVYSYQEILARFDASDCAAVELFIEQELIINSNSAECSNPADEQMIRERIESNGGYSQLDTVVFNKRKELTRLIASRSGNKLLQRLGQQLKMRIDPWLEVNSAGQKAENYGISNGVLPEGQQFHLLLVVHPELVGVVPLFKGHFNPKARKGPNASVCICDPQTKVVIEMLNSYPVRCMVLCAPGSNLIHEKIPENELFSFMRAADIVCKHGLNFNCPQACVVCQKYGARLTARAAVRAGAKVVIWFGCGSHILEIADAFHEGTKNFFTDVLLLLIDQFLTTGMDHTEIMSKVSAVVDHSGFGDSELVFGVETAEADSSEHNFFGTELKQSSPMLYLNSLTEQKVSAVVENISLENKLRRVEHCFCQADVKTVRNAAQCLEADQERCVYIGDHASNDVGSEETSTELSCRARAAALHLCTHFLTKCRKFDVVWRIGQVTDMTKIEEMLNSPSVESMLVWADIEQGAGSRFFTRERRSGDLTRTRSGVREFLETLMNDPRVRILLTGAPNQDLAMNDYVHSHGIMSYVCRSDQDANSGREFSAIRVDLKLCDLVGPDGEMKLETSHYQSQLELHLETEVEAMWPCDDGSLIISIQAQGIAFLHVLRDKVLEGTLAALIGEQFDVAHFATNYDDASLMLDKPTSHQWKALQQIFEQGTENTCVLLRALAGAGKTFILTYLLLQILKSPDAQVLLVCNTSALALHVGKWLWMRTESSHRLAMLNRLHFVCLPYEDGMQCMKYNAHASKLEVVRHDGPALAYTFTVVDEAHHCCQTSKQYDFIREKAGKSSSMLICSDLSQGVRGGVRKWFKNSEGKAFVPTDMANVVEVKLTQVVRSTQRIVMGSLAFGLEEHKQGIDCATPCQGPPIKTFIFNSTEAQYFYEYAAQTMRALAHIESQYSGLPLGNRMLLIVPNETFLEQIAQPLQAALSANPSTAQLKLVRSGEAAALMGPQANSTIVLDCVSAVDGLERLFSVCIGLDSVGSTIDQVRSLLYRGMTRAQLKTTFVNEYLAEGFLAFLGFVSAPGSFDVAQAKAHLNANAVGELESQSLNRPDAGSTSTEGPVEPRSDLVSKSEPVPAVNKEKPNAAGVHSAQQKPTINQNIFDISDNVALDWSFGDAQPSFMPFSETCYESEILEALDVQSTLRVALACSGESALSWSLVATKFPQLVSLRITLNDSTAGSGPQSWDPLGQLKGLQSLTIGGSKKAGSDLFKSMLGWATAEEPMAIDTFVAVEGTVLVNRKAEYLEFLESNHVFSPQLKRYSVYYTNANPNMVDDEILQTLFKRYRHMQKVEVGSCCNAVTDDAFIYLTENAEGIQAGLELEYIYLVCCTKITGRGGSKLGWLSPESVLQHLPKLDQFCLAAGRNFKVGASDRSVIDKLVVSCGVTFNHWSPDW